MAVSKEESLNYHRKNRPGKIEIKATKSLLTSRDLSMAYSPGVSYPCLEIEENPQLAYEYTAKGNLVAVITNGTAVLGLGNIGSLAGKPVMEGKGVLFKKFADIDVFDLELNTDNPDQFIQAVKALEPTFGGINLEDISAPDCFYIEEQLKNQLKIPVFHDDQHGTAIISTAALLNAVELTGKKIDEIKVVYNGAGAAGIACCKLHFAVGVKKENVILCDSKGVIYKGRKEGMNPYKKELAAETDRRTLEEALAGADVFVGISVKDALKPEMLKKMADNPVIFALANPDPEIDYDLAKKTRPDAIMATGRSDYPNQVNNVLGFPYIFRGALDCQATEINDEMKLAAAKALAELTKQDVPDSVLKAYGVESLSYGNDYLIPKPFDPRAMLWVTPAVAEAATKSGVAGKPIEDIEGYRYQLEKLMGMARQVMRIVINKAKKDLQKIVLPEGDHPLVIMAAQAIKEERIGIPVLLGNRDRIKTVIREKKLHVSVRDLLIVDPMTHEKLDQFAKTLLQKRERKGFTRDDSLKLMRSNRNYFAAAMVSAGDADAMLSGITSNYSNVILPALQLIDKEPGVNRICSLHMIMINKKLYFFADTIVNVSPDAQTMVEIVLQTAKFVRELNIEPNVALLSYSNFGSSRNKETLKIAQAVKMIRELDPELNVDGEMMIDFAINPELRNEHYPFSTLKGVANVFIFPELNSANIASRMINRLGLAEKVGPIILGFKKSVHTLHRGSELQDIINMAAIAAMDAREKAKNKS
ncbi:MAG: NADP-dependent malic enzyme [Desulfobacteraceae bacterium]|jgi:malate dehydrogenase (oxaloacetate-decarboxylating)(NADP+)